MIVDPLLTELEPNRYPRYLRIAQHFAVAERDLVCQNWLSQVLKAFQWEHLPHLNSH
jgi:hypothetical protein